MLKYILKRLLRSLVTLFIVVTVVFLLLRLMPIEGYFNNYDKMSPTQIRVGMANLGLDKPITTQLFNFWKQILQGNLGTSTRYRVGYSINKIIASKMPMSLRLGGLAFLVSLGVGLPLGILMARSARSKSRFKIADRLGTMFVVLIQGVPTAVYALLVMFLGNALLNKFTYVPFLFDEGNPISWVLPVVALSLANLAMYAMWLRRYMVDESSKDYVQLARAKGVPQGKISRGHIFRNAVVPLVQYFPTSIVLILMGSLYIESLFSVPGMGGLLVDVIQRQDNTMVQALVLVYTAMSVLGVLIGDILMAVLDPRINYASKGGAR